MHSRTLSLLTFLVLIPAILKGSPLPGLSAGDWELVETTGTPVARHETSFVEVDGLFYLIGGREANGRIDRFDPATSTWSAMGATSPLIHHFQPVVIDRRIWMVGAMTGKFPLEPPMERIHIYDPLADTWEEGPAIPQNRRRGSAGTVVYDGKIYMACGITLGHTSGTNGWFDMFDPQTGEWAVLPDAPHIRDHFHAVVLDDKLYCIGGRNTSMHEKGNPDSLFRAIVREIDVYDFKSGSWSTLETRLPVGSAAAGTAVLDGRIIYFGGEDAVTALGRTWVFDPVKESWTEAGRMIQGRHGSQAVVHDGCIYVAAGSPKRGGGKIDSVEKFTLSGRQPDVGIMAGEKAAPLQNPMGTDYLLANIRREHPRMVLTPELELRLKEKVRGDPVVGNLYAGIRMNAVNILDKPLLKRVKTGRRLLDVSREMLYRINMLGMVYRMERDPEFLDRIDREVIAVCEFSDWNPSHFLDVGEMSLAVALALDWTHGDLPQSTVAMAKQALVEKALAPGWESPRAGRTYAENNWNQVCNGGLVAAAIAVAEEEPELAAKTVWRALDGLPVALQYYGPDGTHHEGSTYWNYATEFTAALSSILRSAFGSDFGIWEYPGIAPSAVYRQVMTAPSGWYYNYGDCGEKHGGNGDTTLLWFAANSGNAGYVEREKFLRPPADMGKLGRLDGLGLIWLAQFEERFRIDIPVNWYARGINPVVIFGAGQNDPHGYYLGAKGGCGAVNHGNMDAGSFVFELNGVRWSVDPGKQNYNEIEQTGFNLWGKTQDADRWKLLSKNNFGHSTVSVNGRQHVVDGTARLIEFRDGDNPLATFDLSPVFGDSIDQASRSFLREGPQSLVITDRLVPSSSADSITWQLVTVAEVEPVGGGAILRQDGQSLRLECLSHPQSTPTVTSLDPPPMDLDSRIRGLKRIDLEVPVDAGLSGEVEFIVRLSANH